VKNEAFVRAADNNVVVYVVDTDDVVQPITGLPGSHTTDSIPSLAGILREIHAAVAGVGRVEHAAAAEPCKVVGR
jgi:hypothetical protein